MLHAEVQTIQFQPSPSSSLELFVDKTGALSGKRHRFVFDRFQGRLEYYTSEPAKSRVTLRIDSTSIVCKDTWVSQGDLKKVEKAAKTDMLAVDQYPALEFASTAVEAVGLDRFRVSGTLTIRGRAKPAIVDVERVGDMFKGTAVVRLTDYGLKPPSAAFGIVGTKNEMNFQFNLSAKQE